MNRIGVFCGSSAGSRADYTDAAVELVGVLAERRMGLVYGGGRVGLMGRIAEAMRARGGEVIGVIPEFLRAQELAYDGVTELRQVQSMSERKAVIAELSDAFVALPGGYGTLDELIEMVTWTQLGIHQKPCGLLNTCGFYDGLIAFIEHTVAENFVQEQHRSILVVESEPAALIDRLSEYQHRAADKTKWITDLEDGGGRSRSS